MALRYSLGLFALAVMVACGGKSTSRGLGEGSGAAAAMGGGGGTTGGSGGSTTGSGGRGAGAAGGTGGSGATGGSVAIGGSGATGATGAGATGAVAAFGGTGGASTGGTGSDTCGRGGCIPDLPGEPTEPLGPVFCGGAPCDAPLACCTATGTCFDPVDEPEACKVPPPDDTDLWGRKPCSSNAHCGPREYCQMDLETCIGSGHCNPRTNCGACFGDACTICGCDGNTYPNPQTACLAGVNYVHGGPCGEPKETGGAGAGGKIPCAYDDHCPEGQVCCARLAECTSGDDPFLCGEPPPGTRKPCVTNEHCEPYEYCLGEGCEGAGGCVLFGSQGECGVELEPVCGCDGVSYTSAACASTEGVRVAFPGQCPAK